MSRKIKHSLAVALALVAFGAITASAHAADEFHCSVSPCRLTAQPDGTGKSAHHVIIIETATTDQSLVITCETLRGHIEVVGLFGHTLFFFTAAFYDNCTVNGSAGVEVAMNGCEYKFNAAGGTTDAANLAVVCPSGKKIEFKYNGCTMTISGGFESSGVGYTTVGTTPTREITVTINHVTIPSANIKADGTKAQCLIDPEQSLTGTYTTGNTRFTGETTAGVMADAWYE